MAWVAGRKKVNRAAARAPETRREIRRVTHMVDHRASRNLAQARASTAHEKIADPGHLTRIGSFLEEVDGVVWMEAYKQGAMALEFGHFPSGVFDPEVWGEITKSPHGLYILNRAAMLGGSTSVSSGRKRGKR